MNILLVTSEFYQNSMKIFRSQVLGSADVSLWDIESSPGNSSRDLGHLKVCESSQEDTENSEIVKEGFLEMQQAAYRGLFDIIRLNLFCIL